MEYTDLNTGRATYFSRPQKIVVGISIVTAIIIVLTGIAVAVQVARIPSEVSCNCGNDAPCNYPTTLSQAMIIPRLMTHLKKFESFANMYNGTRATNYINGYNASVNYVVQQLKMNTNYNVVVQPFVLERFYYGPTPATLSVQSQASRIDYVVGVDFANWLGNAPSNTNPMTNPVTVVANRGCDPSDYSAVTAGSVALIWRGNCTFVYKLTAAAAAGASAAIIYNSNLNGQTGVPVFEVMSTIPVFGLSYAAGVTLTELSQPVATYSVDQFKNSITTYNIIADTPTGDPANTIVVGSHLDSVPAGPGINDNGSGSTTNLELAIQLTNISLNVNLVNRIRFCWWGAEELGLLGSSYYVNDLVQNNKAELAKIALNLNFDMLGSPNYFRGVYDGINAVSPVIRAGSSAIQALFARHFDSRSLVYDYTGFDGRSDYGPFIAQNISAGGLFTGAEVPKTMQMRSRYGGIGNAAYDPCYHRDCDTVENINQEVLQQMATAAGYVTQTLAMQQNLRSYLNNYNGGVPPTGDPDQEDDGTDMDLSIGQSPVQRQQRQQRGPGRLAASEMM